MADVPLFDMNLQQLKEERDHQEELIKSEWDEKRPDQSFIQSCYKEMKLRRRTPLQADGVSKAPPHESGTR